MEICSINLWFSVDIRLHPDIYKVVYRNVGGEFPGNKDSDPNKRVASHCVVYKPSHVGRLCGAFRGSRLAVGGQQHWSHWMWFDLLWSTSWFRKPPEAAARWRRAGASCSLKTLTFLHLWPHFRRGNMNVNIRLRRSLTHRRGSGEAGIQTEHLINRTYRNLKTGSFLCFNG